jgi:hypothetical protein
MEILLKRRNIIVKKNITFDIKSVLNTVKNFDYHSATKK